jgi:predicted dehydrogenase
MPPSRRDLLAAAAGTAAGLAAAPANAAEPAGKVIRVGLLSASIGGKPQPTNGHTWHFASYFHPKVNLDAVKKYAPHATDLMAKYVHNPRANFDQLPFPDTVITHYYAADPKATAMYCEAFPGVQPAKSPEELAASVDAVWLGDASGRGEDHLDLIGPALQRGLPCFCDKPIGGSVAGTRQILELARKHNAPLMSGSIFRFEWGTEHALRLRDSNEFGRLEYVIASMAGGYTPEGWVVYGQHPAWMVVTLLGAGVEAVSLYARENVAHGLVTYPDRMPGEIWYGRPAKGGFYNHTTADFVKKTYEWTPAIEGDFLFGHHYEMFRMAATFRQMCKDRKEPVPHPEILAVTAIVHAGVKSLAEKSRLVALTEALG